MTDHKLEVKVEIDPKTNLPRLPKNEYWHVKWNRNSLEWYELSRRRRFTFLGIPVGYKTLNWTVIYSKGRYSGHHVKRTELTEALILQNAADSLPTWINQEEILREEALQTKAKLREVKKLTGSYPPKRLKD